MKTFQEVWAAAVAKFPAVLASYPAEFNNALRELAEVFWDRGAHEMKKDMNLVVSQKEEVILEQEKQLNSSSKSLIGARNAIAHLQQQSARYRAILEFYRDTTIHDGGAQARNILEKA